MKPKPIKAYALAPHGKIMKKVVYNSQMPVFARKFDAEEFAKNNKRIIIPVLITPITK